MTTHFVRLLADSRNNSSIVNDAITRQLPFWWSGNAFSLQLALAVGSTFLTAADVGTITLEIKPISASATSAPLVQKTFTAADCDSDFEGSQWEQAVESLLVAEFTEAEASLGKGRYRLIVIHTAPNGTKTPHLSTGIDVTEDYYAGPSVISPPPIPTEYYTKAESDSRFATDAASVGLGNVDNTSDEDKPVSTAQAAAIAAASSGSDSPSGVLIVDLEDGDDAAALAAVTQDAFNVRSYPLPFATISAAYDASRRGEEIRAKRGRHIGGVALTGDRAASLRFESGSTWEVLAQGSTLVATAGASDRFRVYGDVSYLIARGKLFAPTFAATLEIEGRNILGDASSAVYHAASVFYTEFSARISKTVEADRWVYLRESHGKASIFADEVFSLAEQVTYCVDALGNEGAEVLISARVIDDGVGNSGGGIRAAGDGVEVRFHATESISHRRLWGSGDRGFLHIDTEAIGGSSNLGSPRFEFKTKDFFLNGTAFAETGPSRTIDGVPLVVIDCENVTWNKLGTENRRFFYNFATATNATRLVFPRKTRLKITGDGTQSVISGGGVEIECPNGLVTTNALGVVPTYGAETLDANLPDYTEVKEPVEVWWLWGQSNAWGATAAGSSYTLNGSESDTPYRWSSGTPPQTGRSAFGDLVPKGTTTGLVPALYPLRDIAAASPKKFVLLETALGSTALSPNQPSDNNWTFGSELYDVRVKDFFRESYAMLRAMGYAPRLRVCLAFQGEGDASDATFAAQWGDRFADFVNEMRNELNAHSMGAIVCQTWRSDDTNDVVNVAQQDFVSSDLKAAYIVTEDVDRTDVNEVHVTAAGMLALSPRIIAAYNALK